MGPFLFLLYIHAGFSSGNSSSAIEQCRKPCHALSNTTLGYYFKHFHLKWTLLHLNLNLHLLVSFHWCVSKISFMLSLNTPLEQKQDKKRAKKQTKTKEVRWWHAEVQWVSSSEVRVPKRSPANKQTETSDCAEMSWFTDIPKYP